VRADECFLKYELGDEHQYEFDGGANIDHITAAGSTGEKKKKKKKSVFFFFFQPLPQESRVATNYRVHLSATVTMVGIDDNLDRHMKLEVREASYVDDTAAAFVAAHGDIFKDVPDQTARDESYLRSMSKPLYFVQSCAGEVTRIFHPDGEDVAILNMKKSFLQTISLRMSDDKSAAHTETHHDNHGKRSVAYAYAGDARADLTVATSHDTVHDIDAGVFSHTKRYIKARVTDSYSHTFKNGVVHEVDHRSSMAYPLKDAAKRAVVGGGADGGAEVANSASYEATGHTTLRLAQVRRRSVAAGTAELELDVRNMHASLQRRHALDFVDTESVQHVPIKPAVPASFADAIADLDHEDEQVRASTVAFKAYVAAHEASSIVELRAMFSNDNVGSLTRVMRQRVLNAVAQLGSEPLQAFLVELVAADQERDDVLRIETLFALPYVMWPSEHLLGAMRALLPERAAKPSEFAKSAALVFGTVADVLHESGRETEARAARFQLYYLLFSATDKDERHVYSLALENALSERVEAEDDLAWAVTQIVAKLKSDAPHLVNKRGDPEISIEYGNGSRACFGCDPADPDNFRGTWKQSNYTFDWSAYRQMLLSFDWVKENKCPIIDGVGVPTQPNADPAIEGICRSVGYRALGVTPPDLSEDDKRANPNHKQWLFRDKLGFNPIFAALEAKLDLNGRQPLSRVTLGHDLFAGAIVEVEVFGIAFHIVSAYMKFKTVTASNPTQAQEEELAACGSIKFELYHKFANKAYYAKLEFTQAGTDGTPGCIPVRQTCMPNRRPLNVTDSNTFRREVTFFQKATPADFKVGPFPVMASLIGEGVAVLHFSPPFFLYSELEGGTQLSTTVEPEGAVRLRASASVSFDIHDNNPSEGFSISQLLDGASLGAEANLEVVRVSFPASAAFNFGTLMPCAQVGISTSALGGKVYLIATILGARLRVKVLEWKGKEWENFPFEVPCCKFCEAPCKDRSKCNFATGNCDCIDGWDGVACDIECPVDQCGAERIGVLCTQQGALPPNCECDPGSYGFNCELECPGGRQTPCNGHGTCDDVGACTCEPYYFGPACDKNCAVNGEAPELACKHAEGLGYCSWDGTNAVCECYPGHVGENCDKACPSSPDPRQYTCSLRGECTETPDGKPSCLCDLGFHGNSCELIDFDGSGLALSFKGGRSDAADVVTWQFATDYIGAVVPPSNGGLMTSMWVRVDALPTGGPATLAKWKYGAVALDAAGLLSMCDNVNVCATLAAPLAVGKWYFVSASMQSLAADGARAISAQERGQAAATARKAGTFTPFGLTTLTVGHGFAGAIDMLSIVDDVSDDIKLKMSRSTVAASTPGLIFYALGDMGRGRHAMAETPFLAGAMGDNVNWVDSGVNVETSTVNSDVWPRFSLAIRDGKYSVSRAYTIQIDGKKLSTGTLEYTLGVPTAQLCPITVMLEDVVVVMDAPQTRGRHYLQLPIGAISRLRDGETTVTFSLGAGAGEHCKQTGLVPSAAESGYTGPVFVDRSFLTIFTQPADGVVEFTGVSVGYIEAPNTLQLGNAWSLEMWFKRAAKPSAGGALLSISNAMPSQRLFTDAANAMFNTPFALFDSGGSGFGLRMLHSGVVQAVETYQVIGGEWTHAMAQVSLSGKQCRVSLIINGNEVVPQTGGELVGLPLRDCSRAMPDGFMSHPTLQGLTMRIGHRLEGQINDVIFHNKIWTPSEVRLNMNLLKPFAAPPPSWLLAYSFNEDSATEFADSTAGNVRPGKVRDGVFRGLVYGVQHRWKGCPGVTTRTPQRVCSNDATYERGVCGVAKESVSLECDCNEGFAGPSCQVTCPGGLGNICSGHGRCFTSNDTFCICDPGYVGHSCGLLCPGFLAPDNVKTPKVCSAYGECKAADDGSKGECHCKASSNRYGAWCQFEQGKLPILERDCEDCAGPNEYCHPEEKVSSSLLFVDVTNCLFDVQVCVCKDGFFMVDDTCTPSDAPNKIALSMMAAVVMLVAIAIL
jgi:hypothetical protein